MNGDTLISGAFLAYIGFFDHMYRRKLLSEWKEYLQESLNFPFSAEYGVIVVGKEPHYIEVQVVGLDEVLYSQNDFYVCNFHNCV